MNKRFKKSIVWLLTLTMLVSLVPLGAVATEYESSATETVEAPVGITGANELFPEYGGIHPMPELHDPVTIQRIDGLSPDFYMGADISDYDALFNAGVR